MRARLATVDVLLILLMSATLGSGQDGEIQRGVVGGEQYRPDYDRAPRPIKITGPRYPDEALAQEIEGTVVIEALIDEEGRVIPRRVLHSIPGLDAAAMETVERWVFSPAMKEGRPIAIVVQAPVVFRLDTKPSSTEGTGSEPQRASIAPRPRRADFTPWLDRFRDETLGNWLVPQAATAALQGHADIEPTVERDGSTTSMLWRSRMGSRRLTTLLRAQHTAGFFLSRVTLGPRG
jgi:protein TonB